jgi:hypothetical protein
MVRKVPDTPAGNETLIIQIPPTCPPNTNIYLVNASVCVPQHSGGRPLAVPVNVNHSESLNACVRRLLCQSCKAKVAIQLRSLLENPIQMGTLAFKNKWLVSLITWTRGSGTIAWLMCGQSRSFILNCTSTVTTAGTYRNTVFITQIYKHFLKDFLIPSCFSRCLSFFLSYLLFFVS